MTICVLQAINFPLGGVIAGVIVGLSPLGPLLFQPLPQTASNWAFEARIALGEHLKYDVQYAHYPRVWVFITHAAKL